MNNPCMSLQWRHNGCDGLLNHQPHDCLLNRLFRRKSKKTSKLHVTGLCAGNSPVNGGQFQLFHSNVYKSNSAGYIELRINAPNSWYHKLNFILLYLRAHANNHLVSVSVWTFIHVHMYEYIWGALWWRTNRITMYVCKPWSQNYYNVY